MQNIKDFPYLIQELKNYLSQTPGLTVTIYLNTSPVWDQNEESRLSLKKVISDVRKTMEEAGVSPSQIEKMLKQPKDFLEDNQAWKSLKEGIVFFLSHDSHNISSYLLPFFPGNSYLMDTYYNLKPLTHALYSDYEYYLLLLNQKQVELYHGYADKLTKYEAPNIPSTIDEALWVDDPEISIQHKSSKKVGPGTGGAMVYHGHGAAKDPKDERLERFSNIIDKEVRNAVNEKYLPLIVTCDKSLWPTYKKQSEYPKLIPECIPGDVRNLSLSDLGKKSWEILKKQEKANIDESVNMYKNALGTGRAVFGVNDTVKAAVEGEVEILFLEPAETYWGSYNHENALVEVHSNRQKNGEYDNDLVNLALVETLDNGGVAYVTTRHKNTFKNSLNALLRY